MLEAMVSAPLGDDVLGDDPTVKELEAFAAEAFGTEAAVYLPSGTMANQAAIRSHAGPGDEALLEETCHVFMWEQGGAAQLSGVQLRPLPGERGRVSIDALERGLRLDDPHCPVTRLVILENTHATSGGSVLPIDHLDEVRAFTRKHGLALHVDGARIAHASAATGLPLSEYGSRTDSISCCLSKGLGAPVGSLLAGSGEFIARARRARKVFGGAMRQAGVIAAAGLVALRDQAARLTEDHERARALGEGLGRLPGLEVVSPETNMVWVRCPGRAESLATALEAEGVGCLSMDADTLRFVTHLDVDDDDVSRAVEVMARVSAP
jgi:threonine aldolase